MNKADYEVRIRELENQFRVMEERYQILVETTEALLFEYQPEEDIMIFTNNFPDNKSRHRISKFHKFVNERKLIHPDHSANFLNILSKAATTKMRGEIEFMAKYGGNDFQWHKAYYSSIAEENRKVIRIVGRIDNIHQSATERQMMMHKVETDFLTGLYNKKAAMERISEWLKLNSTKEAYMIIMDLDDFKKVNDVYGHGFGDDILKDVAQILVEAFPKGSILSRFGGDEFIIFLQEDSLRHVESKVDSAMQRIEDEGRKHSLILSCSVGIAVRMSKYDDFEDMFNRADNAMYQAKKRGKDRYFIYRE